MAVCKFFCKIICISSIILIIINNDSLFGKMKSNLNCIIIIIIFWFILVGIELPHNIEIFSSTYCCIETLSIQLVSIIREKKMQKWIIECGGE